MQYELSSLYSAIEKVSALVEKYKDHQHAYDYYSTMQEALLAISYAIEKVEENAP